MGRLKTVPKHAHCISDLLNMDRITPIILTNIIIAVILFVIV